MNGIQMKRIVLRFLLVCNLVLLTIIAAFGVRAMIGTSQQSRETAALLQSRGVELSGDVYRALLQEKTAYTLRTDIDEQTSFCRAVLGSTLESDAASGGSIRWKSGRGSVTWNNAGTVSGTVDLSNYGVPTSAEDAASMIQERLRAAGINLRQTAVEASGEDSALVVRVQEGVAGSNLSGCEMKFELDDKGTATISGMWCFGEPQPVEMTALDDSTPADILLALVNAHTDVTQITAAQQVYILTNRSGGRFSIHPCWKLTTDKGDFVIDPLTGQEVTESIETQETTGTTTDAADGTTTTDGTQSLPDDSSTGADSTTTDATDGTTTEDSGTDTPSITGDDNWDSTQGTDKTDPEIPDEHGVYG